MAYFILSVEVDSAYVSAVLFNEQLGIQAQAKKKLTSLTPDHGWLEQNPVQILDETLNVCQTVFARTGIDIKTIIAIGITNQRETTVLWDTKTGKPVSNAIDWRDTRSQDLCDQLINLGHDEMVREKTGLLIHPYFPAPKLAWILNHDPSLRAYARRGDLAFGTLDSYILWHLSDKRVHATDASNASRTLLYNIHKGEWDQELLDLFDIPESVMPKVLNSSDDYGYTEPTIIGARIPVCAMIGNMQASMIGEACYQPGTITGHYGVGSFLMLNTGETPLFSANSKDLLTTIAYQLNDKRIYALEGGGFGAGNTLAWLKHGLYMFSNEVEIDTLLQQSSDNERIYFIPASSGSASLSWEGRGQGAIYGLTYETRHSDIIRAALEAGCFQTNDVLEIMKKVANQSFTFDHPIRVSGEYAESDWLMQRLADLLHLTVERSVNREVAAFGVSLLTSLRVGLINSLEDGRHHWRVDKRFPPTMSMLARNQRCEEWKNIMNQTLSVRKLVRAHN